MSVHEVPVMRVDLVITDSKEFELNLIQKEEAILLERLLFRKFNVEIVTNKCVRQNGNQ